MLVQLESVELALLRVPIGADPLKGCGPVEEACVMTLTFASASGRNPPSKYAIAFFASFAISTSYARRVLGGRCAAL
jgi:hypothetical protein